MFKWYHKINYIYYIKLEISNKNYIPKNESPMRHSTVYRKEL